MSGPYIDELVFALRLRDVSRDRIGQVVADVETHVATTGEDPVDAFGTAAEYAMRVAARLRMPITTWADVLRAYPPVLGAMLAVDSLWGVLTGYRAAVSVGEAVAFLLLPPAAAVLMGLAGRGPDPGAGSGAGSPLRSGAMRFYATVAGVAVVVAGALFLGAGVMLLRYPAWVGLAVGLALVVGGLWLMRRATAADRAGGPGGLSGPGGASGRDGRAAVPVQRRRHAASRRRPRTRSGPGDLER
jgi:hypothetical protein